MELFTPINIKGLSIPNRLVVPAMVMGFCDKEGMATERYIAYHKSKAEGGWGLIITEDYAIDPLGIGNPNIPGLWKDEQINSHAELTRAVHKANGRIMAQIYHAGRQTNARLMGHQPIAPSAIPCPVMNEKPRELTLLEIEDLVEKFGDCAYRAKLAGFDGVEIHGAHGYLVNQFISPTTNRRTDKYGGCLHNRMRFPLEIITRVKEKAGIEFPVVFRISAQEFTPGGITLEDSLAIAQLLEGAGADAIHVSAGTYAGGRFYIIPPAAVPHGWNIHAAEIIRKAVSIPVITVGRINDPLLAEAIIASGIADLVSMGRASLADPELPNKTEEGKLDEIIYCIGCMQGCWGKDSRGACILNPLTGKEEDLKIEPASVKKKVVVIGGGPAGMQAAIVAAQRGHEVSLYEKSNRLGGQYRLAAIPPTKEEILAFIAWQQKQMEKYDVKVYLNSEANEVLIAKESPDQVIIATGSKPRIPDIKGILKENVFTAQELLEGTKTTGRNVVIIGGGLIGLETAHYLSGIGITVTIIENKDVMGEDMEPAVKHFLMNELNKHEIKLIFNSEVIEITDDIAYIKGLYSEEISSLNVDTVILAVGTESNVSPINEYLKKSTYNTIIIGDARLPRNARFAIEEGYRAGLMI